MTCTKYAVAQPTHSSPFVPAEVNNVASPLEVMKEGEQRDEKRDERIRRAEAAARGSATTHSNIYKYHNHKFRPGSQRNERNISGPTFNNSR